MTFITNQNCSTLDFCYETAYFSMWVQDLYPKVKCKCQNKETLDSKSDMGTPLSILVNHNMLVWFYLCTNSPTQRESDMPAKCRYKKCLLKKNLLTLRISTISPGSLLEDTYLQLTQQTGLNLTQSCLFI